MPEVSGDLITRNYSNFRGVDFSNTEVALYRSPDAINMWKDYKKMGTSIETRPDIVLFKELKNTVYGLFFYTINQVDHMIIHCGVSLYDYNMKTEKLKTIKEKGMNIRKSQSFIYRNILYIKDGLNYLQYDGETCKEVIGYIPITTIGKAPSGGGTTNQEVNLLTGVRENSFCADGESTEYVLDASELDAGYQEKVFINNVEKTEGFTVDKVSGKVNFTTAPEKPLTDGQDNVVIRFSKTIPGNRDKINKCTILEVFDNRVFFSGNQDYPNTVFHTMLDEPKYCSDLDYYNEGADISPVRGMVAGNNALWVIKEPSQANTAIFYHNPTIDSEAGKVYPSEHSSISTGCIGAAINFNDDIVYFSNRGMEGISGDITTEQVISHRSSLVDSKLLQEENYKDMILVEYEGYLLVIINNKIYLADSRAMFTNENHNEYEWFYWEIDIKPTCAVVYNGELYLGSKQGIFKIGKASESNKEISMEKDEEERYFIDGVTKQETGTESYKTVTGKEITIKDGENSKGLEIKLKGSTTQSTRSGKNICPVSAFDTMDSNGASNTYSATTHTITMDVDATGASGRYCRPVTNLEIGETYTISFDIRGTSGKKVDCGWNGAKKTITLEENFVRHSSSLIATIANAPVVFYSWALANGGLASGEYMQFANVQIEKGDTATDYEEYGAMPSPDYPSEIENVEGKNKFDFAKITAGFETTVTQIENGVNVEGKWYSQYPIKLNNGIWNVSYIYKLVSGTANSTTGLWRIKYADETYSSYLSSGKSIEITKETKNILFYASNGSASISVDFTNIQLEEGTVATSYVPYNSLEVKVVNKNIFDESNATTQVGYFSSNGTLNSGGGSTVITSYISIKPNTDMTLSGFKLEWICFYDKNKNFIERASCSTNNINTFNKNAYYIRIQAETSVFNLDLLQLEQGSTATDYEEHQKQIVYFPLAEGQKLMEGSYLSDDGIHHKRKQVVFDGSNDEGWTLWTALNEKVITFYISNAINTSSTNLLCDYFINDIYGVFDKEHVAVNVSNGYFSLSINKSILTTQDVVGLRTWLSTHPITVEYDLAEPEIIPYTEEQQEAWNKIENMKLYDGINYIESTAELDIKYNYIYKKPSIKNKSSIENKISSGEYQTIINNKRYFVFLEEELKSVRNDITDRLYIDTNKNIAKVMKRVDKLVLNGTEEWNVNTTHSNVFYTAKPKNMADNETNIFCTITDEFSKDLSGETYGILIDTNINIKIPKVKTVADLKAYLAKEPITIQYKATEEIKDIILLSKPSSYWTTCEDEFKYPQMQKTTNKRGCVADVIGEEIDVFCKTNKEQFEKIATHKNATGYAVNRIKKKKWKSIQLKFSSNKSFELFSCTLESYIGSYIKR